MCRCNLEASSAGTTHASSKCPFALLVRTMRKKQPALKLRKSRRGEIMQKNTFDFVTSVLMDRTLWRINQVVVELSMCAERFYHEENVVNRSCEETVKWWKDRGSDLGYPEIRSILDMMNNHELYKKIGCLYNASRMELRRGVDHPVACEELNFIGMVFDFSMQLLARRLRSIMVFQTYPGCFPRLIDEATAGPLLAQMREDKELHTWLEGQPGAFFKKLYKRDPLTWNWNVIQIFQLCEEQEWKWSQVLSDTLLAQWRAISSTKLIEDGVRDEKVANVSRNFKSEMGGMKCWNALLDQRSDSAKHRYKTVRRSGVVIARNKAHKSMASLFHVQPNAVPKYMRTIKKGTKTWHGPAPLFAHADVEDRALLRWCKANDSVAEAPLSWLNTLLRSSNVAIRRHNVHGGAWFIPLHTPVGTCPLGLRLSVKCVREKTYFFVDEFETMTFLPILDFYSWKVCEIKPVTPYYVRLSTGNWQRSFAAMTLEQVSDAADLITHSARRGFYDMPKTGLIFVCRHLECPFEKTDSLPVILFKLIEFVLKEPLTLDEKLDLLRRRLPK